MDETMIKVADLREGDVFEVFGGVFSVVRIWGGGDLRTVHLQTWAQGQGAELKLRNAMFVRLVSRVPDEDLQRVQDERTAASLASFDALVREIDEAPDAPEPVELFGSCADPDEPEWTDEDLEINTVTNARERLAAALRERDEARAELERVKAEREEAIRAWDVALREEFGREMAKVQAELERVRKERDGLAVAPLWHPQEPADAPDDGLARDDWEVPPAATASAPAPRRGAARPDLDLRFCVVCATSTLETELHELGDAHLCQWCLADRARDLSAEAASLETQAQDDAPYVSGLEDRLFELKHSDAMRALALRDQHAEIAALKAGLDRVRAERDELLAPICAPSVPEPPPRAGGALVTPLVLTWIASQRANIGQERVDQALRLVMERDAFGRGKYGQGLALEDGRDTVEDLRQELGDAIQYGFKARVEGVAGERLEEVRWHAHLLWLLLCADKVEVAK